MKNKGLGKTSDVPNEAHLSFQSVRDVTDTFIHGQYHPAVDPALPVSHVTAPVDVFLFGFVRRMRGLHGVVQEEGLPAPPLFPDDALRTRRVQLRSVLPPGGPHHLVVVAEVVPVLAFARVVKVTHGVGVEAVEGIDFSA